jgi:hypothetical protein
MKTNGRIWFEYNEYKLFKNIHNDLPYVHPKLFIVIPNKQLLDYEL